MVNGEPVVYAPSLATGPAVAMPIDSPVTKPCGTAVVTVAVAAGVVGQLLAPSVRLVIARVTLGFCLAAVVAPPAPLPLVDGVMEKLAPKSRQTVLMTVFLPEPLSAVP